MNHPPDESGAEAWLRYRPLQDEGTRALLAPLLACRHELPRDSLVRSATDEWCRGVAAMLGHEAADPRTDECSHAGTGFMLDPALGPEAYRLLWTPPAGPDGRGRLEIRGGDGHGVLYGTFAALRQLQGGTSPDKLAGESSPDIPLRVLNHWDNPVEDPVLGSIERVWGGKTLFDWTDLGRPNPRYRDYARLLASVGINGSCLNNVNATPEILSKEMLENVAVLAALLRDWGIRVYLSIDYSSPVFLGGLDSADPLHPGVQRWWREKADEIYSLMPDFGGFVVKADSEGRPGPGWYGRNHAEGSRVLADALQPHGGTVFWRAFVYGRDLSAKTPNERVARDRANHATYEFMDLDGAFADNVILQVKCSATDFQPWEPPHAIFGRMPKTRLAIEMDLAHEYTGYDVALAWEGPYWEHVLNFDTRYAAPSGRIADIVGGRCQEGRPGAIAGVANISDARNWFGHLLGGATLYAFGRQAWDTSAEASSISREYSELVFGAEAAETVASLLDASLDTYFRYNCPLGVGNLWEHLHHMLPDPWNNLAGAGITREGIGRDRTAAGSQHLLLYHPEVSALFANPETCPDRYLLYFHHLPWRYRLKEGRTLIQKIYDDLFEAVDEVRRFRATWRSLHGRIDLDRWAHVYEKMALQIEHAETWRDVLCRFFLEYSGVPDEKNRFDAQTPSPRSRLRSGFPQAVEDYIARVERLRERVAAKVKNDADFA